MTTVLEISKVLNSDKKSVPYPTFLYPKTHSQTGETCKQIILIFSLPNF